MNRDIANEEELDDLLMLLNEKGIAPVVVGHDNRDIPFLVYGHAPGGDGWGTGLVTDNPVPCGDFDYNDAARRCDECLSYDHRPLSSLIYPVTVFVPKPGEPV